MVLDSLSIAAAWEKAWKDPVTKERHFSTPLSLYSKRKPTDLAMPPRDTGKGQKGQKGQKGRGRGAGRAFKGHAATRTGEPICFRFNTKEGCNLANCKFKHVCVIASTRVTTSLLARSASRRTPRGGTDSAPTAASLFMGVSFGFFICFVAKPRKRSLEAHLAKLAPTYGIPLKVEAVDILRKPFTDLSNLQTQNIFLERVRDGSYFAVVLSPPCSTFSRAPWRNRRGPRPIRSYEYPDGLPGLRWAERRKARLGNILADFSLRVAAAALDLQCSFVLLEQPEDLGAVATGHRPSSMWQRPLVP